MRLPDYLLSPLTWVLVLVLLLIFSWRCLPRAIRCLGVMASALLLLLMAPVGANLLVLAVESRAPLPQACVAPTPTTIVLLDGGTDRRPYGPNDFTALNAASLRRLFVAVALWRHTPESSLVISGGGAGVPHAVLLRGLAERMGVSAAAIRIEGRSFTTWENALYTSELSPALPKRIWLVTSALHVPRALGAFRAWGFEPCAWSSGSMHVPFGFHLGYFVPQSSSLAKADMAIHEIVGGVVYRGLEWRLRRKQIRPGSIAHPSASTNGPHADG